MVRIKLTHYPFLDSLAFSRLLMLPLPFMAAPRPDYFMGNVNTLCPACQRWFRYRSTQYTRSIKCPYRDCSRRFHVHIDITPATSKPYQPPTLEDVEPTATPLDPDG